MPHDAWTPVSTHALELGEGLRAGPGGVRWVDLMSGELYAWTPGSGAPVLTHKLDRPLGVTELDRAGRLIAAAGTGITELLDGGGERVLADTGLDPVRHRVNDGAFAPDGSFWFGTMVHDGSEPCGAVWRWDPASNDVVKLLDGISTPNGPAFLPNNGAGVLVADSDAGRILHTTVADPAAVTPFADVAGGSPDGMHMDARGRIWNAVWGAARIDVYAEDAQLLGSVPLPVSQPTSVLLTADPDPLLLVTSALTGLKEPGALDGFTLSAPLSQVLPGFVA